MGGERGRGVERRVDLREGERGSMEMRGECGDEEGVGRRWSVGVTGS